MGRTKHTTSFKSNVKEWGDGKPVKEEIHAKEKMPERGSDPELLIKYMKRTYIKAKIFIEKNMENIDEAMGGGDIPDGQYLSTMDTLMIMKNAVLPMRLHTIKALEIYVKSHKKTGGRNMWAGDGHLPERLALFHSWFREYQDAFNKIFMNRLCDEPSEGNNLMSIDQIAIMYDRVAEDWKGQGGGQIVILMWSDKQAIEMFKAQVMPKWNREFKDRMEEELNELARLGY